MLATWFQTANPIFLVLYTTVLIGGLVGFVSWIDKDEKRFSADIKKVR